MPRNNTGRTAATIGTWNQGMANAWWDEIRRLRSANVVNQFRTNGLYPLIGAPELRDERAGGLLGDGVVAAGNLVRLAHPADGAAAFPTEIWYTVDGTDPRPPYNQLGTPRGSARRYEQPLVVDASVIIRARRAVRLEGAAGDAGQAKAPVRVASPSLPVTLTYHAVGGASGRGQIKGAPRTVDGVALAEGDRILLKNQSVGSQNGIWVVTVLGSGSNGLWDRAADWDQDGEVPMGTWVRVISGNQNEGTVWRVSNATGVTVGGTAGTSVGFAVFTPWSALMEHRLTVGVPQPAVAISEIHYHPPANQGGSAAEFVEFVHYGRLPVGMSQWWLEGVDFIFPAGFVLAPGQRVVIACHDNPVVLAAQYPGVEPLGYYGGNLSNGGERLTLFDGSNRMVCSVEYDDEYPWPAVADGRGSSLEGVNPGADGQAGGNWQASAVRGGTPGTAGDARVGMLRLCEFHAAAGLGMINGKPLRDFVEVINPGAVAVPLAGWTVNGVALPGDLLDPAARVVVEVPLERSQGEVVLAHAGVTAESIRYGPQSVGFAFYRAGEQWHAGMPSPGGESEPAEQATAVPALRFSEVLADPVPGEHDWLELRNEAALPVVLTGLTFGVGEAAMRVMAPAVIGAGAYVIMRRDEGSRRGDAVQFDLPSSGGKLWWRDTDWQLGDLSIGLQEDGTWALLSEPSRGRANAVRRSMGSVEGLRLNEWQGASEAVGPRGEFIEIFNSLGDPVDAGGLWLGDGPSAAGRLRHWLPTHSFVGPGGHLVLWPAGQRSTAFPGGTPGWPVTYKFRLSAAGHTLTLSRMDGRLPLVDAVSFGRVPVMPRSGGRLLDGAGQTVELVASPGWPNGGGPSPYGNVQPEDVVVALGEPFRLRASVQLAERAFWSRNGQVLADVVDPEAEEGVLERAAAVCHAPE